MSRRRPSRRGMLLVVVAGVIVLVGVSQAGHDDPQPFVPEAPVVTTTAPTTTPAATPTAARTTPRPSPSPTRRATPQPTATHRRTTAPPPAPAPVYYPNCDAARAAGAAPLYRGEPGYRPKLDRDGDGVACES